MDEIKNNEDNLICPRCGESDFDEVDCGPDSYDDDVTYTSYRCQGCKLWYDGWVNKWFDDIESWRDTEDAEEWAPRMNIQ